jgi:hypothetical protein
MDLIRKRLGKVGEKSLLDGKRMVSNQDARRVPYHIDL